jgi:hypothetical protein
MRTSRLPYYYQNIKRKVDIQEKVKNHKKQGFLFANINVNITIISIDKTHPLSKFYIWQNKNQSKYIMTIVFQYQSNDINFVQHKSRYSCSIFGQSQVLENMQLFHM